MWSSLTTICCSALALTAVVTYAKQGESPEALPLFPLRPVWTLSLNNALTSPPRFAGMWAVFAIEGDRLVAYDLIRGEQRWLVTSATVSQSAAGDGLVFVAQSGAIAALNDQDGVEAWKIPFSEPLASRLVSANGWLVAATLSGSVLAYRAIDGKLMWQQETGRVSASPALGSSRVYIPLEDRRILALHIENGQPVWNRRVGGAPNEILVRDDRIYAGTTDNFLYCLKADTGVIDWRWRTGGDVIGQPVADDRRVYFVSLDNVLRALDRKGGTQQWKRGLPFRPRTGPVLVNETVIVGGLSPTVHGYSVRTGAPTGELTLASDPAAPIHIIPGDVAPLVIAVTTDILKGATVLAFTHEIEPKVLPIAPLPNPTKEPIPQTSPTSPPPQTEATPGNQAPVPR